MTYRLSFRIRRPYFEAIVEGSKKVELRRVSPFWERRVERVRTILRQGGGVLAVFVCGRETHRRPVVKVEVGPVSQFLSRDLSAWGREDLGNGPDTPVYAFTLGDSEKVPR